MTKDYASMIALNSTLLGKLISSISDKEVARFNGILEYDKVKKFFADEELVDTVEVFLRNDLSIIRASAQANVHRNTMVYRLEKIKKLLGLDIKKFEDAVTIQIIMLSYKMGKTQKKSAPKVVKPTKREAKPLGIQELK